MTNPNNLADALRNMLGAFDSPVRCLKFPTEFGDTACDIAREVLAEHDAQPAPAPVQVDDMDCPHSAFDACDCYAKPPAPAADGAVELPPLPKRYEVAGDIAYPISEADDGAYVSWDDYDALRRAAIAALRQPVPDAVRELPGRWRKNATELGRSSDPKGIWNDTLMTCAHELESALASQQESRK